MVGIPSGRFLPLAFGIYTLLSISYVTQVNSAVPFGQGQILNPYPIHYSWAFAFSLILYPPEDSALITLGLLKDFDLSFRLCRVFPVVSIEVLEIVRMATFSAGGLCFYVLKKRKLKNHPSLPFWFRLFRSNLACSPMTQFNR